MPKARKDGFWDTILDLFDRNTNPDISDNIQQTLGRILGWNSFKKMWQEVSVDNSGRVIVSNSQISIQPLQFTVISGFNVNFNILRQNDARQGFLLFFDNVSAIQLGFKSGQAANSNLIMTDGSIVKSTSYIGEIWGSTTSSGGSIGIIEW